MQILHRTATEQENIGVTTPRVTVWRKKTPAVACVETLLGSAGTWRSHRLLAAPGLVEPHPGDATAAPG